MIVSRSDTYQYSPRGKVDAMLPNLLCFDRQEAIPSPSHGEFLIARTVYMKLSLRRECAETTRPSDRYPTQHLKVPTKTFV